MSDRSIRRAAERKAAKSARKAQLQGTASSAPLDSPAVSEAQLAANRANAQLSTGATTPEGKAISSRNHTIHGLTAVPTENFKVLSSENQDAYDQMLADYRKEWKPATATEQDMVNRLAAHAWLRDRAIRMQNQILEEVGELVAVEDRRDFSLYMRYYNSHARAYSKALSEIMRLRNFLLRQETQALSLQIRFESQKKKNELHAAKLELLHLKQEAQKQRNQKDSRPSQPLTQAAGAEISVATTVQPVL